MECRSIPIDHRLRHLIRNARPTYTNVGDSEHVEILRIWSFAQSRGLKIARPVSKDGLVILLLRSHSTQDNSHGFLAGKRQFRTTNTISELICAVSNARKGVNDISVFDAIPFLDRHVAEEDIIQKAEYVFTKMLRAKQPDIVISYFKSDISNVITPKFSCRSLGSSFEFDPQGSD
ncbi:hypothetical protein N7508_006283 [Penicillium antarcticum]|uniref:uncharacterized protein n=1 Tax=Penicillium antarcticum TaxID=416450 RepID=UPI0023A5E7AF|nr:uncharacterized protein N7508_006283 [Penicillium antarcticum]KAJ5301420.1 hypothetical protein N7508_006283 [Penicillium antarcticum]